MPAAITISNVKKRYRDVVALKGISLSIEEGEFFALLGPNGAGKTTAINIITGLCNKTSGTVRLFGRDIVTDYQAARMLIGLVPQEFNMDIFERVHRVLYYNAGYFGIPAKERHGIIERLLRQVGLWDRRRARIRELSSGMKRKVMIARALLHRPKILILDEPTAGVDVETRQTMWSFLRELNRQGTTILLTTHYIEEAEQHAERIAIINYGRIIKLDRKENLLRVFGAEHVRVQLRDMPQRLPQALRKYRHVLDGKTLCIDLSRSGMQQLIADLHTSGLAVVDVHVERNTLEDIFIELTRRAT